jgi:predicted RNase H-like HicB family nuclease/uncharacterized damage-inducible protein DinB
MRYSVFLETDDQGRWMAHVLELPGCMVCGASRDEVLEHLPAAIRETWAWLRRHGEPAPPAGEAIEMAPEAEVAGTGPFDPGNTAALFPPEREAITPGEMEQTFLRMSYARADLLALARAVPEDLLDWQPHAGHFTLRRILRHIGNADQWYVSRIVPPENLPPEWAGDEEMPLLGFLEVERRTTVECLRQLTAEQRGSVFHPVVWTDHPEEAWTARKVLRRTLEHEREHTAQIRQVLAARKRFLLARLAAERTGLLVEFLGLDERALTEVRALGDWTVKDILAHVAAWDRWEERTMCVMVAGEAPEYTALEDLDAFNEATLAAWRGRTLATVLAEQEAARAGWIAWLEGLPEEELFRLRSYHGETCTFASLLELHEGHDRQHAEQIAAWREAAGIVRTGGPCEVLLSALGSARHELLAAAAQVPTEERCSHPVCGDWTVKDVLGHVADWEWIGVQGMRLMATGQPPNVEPIQDIDAWNATHVETRREESWEKVWADLHAARGEFLAVCEQMGRADLELAFPFAWGGHGTPYQWLCVYIEHDREHARDLRDATGCRQLAEDDAELQRS